MTELCGHPTKSGKPCNMPKNHNALFHRHREYPIPISWIIADSNMSNVLESGIGREEFGYAVTRCMKKSSKLSIEITIYEG